MPSNISVTAPNCAKIEAAATAIDGPKARWQRDIAAHGFVADPAQEVAVAALESLHRELIDRRPGPLARLRRRWFGPPRDLRPVIGLYLWGGVGRGKTHLMDHFHDALPFGEKRRRHFHRFMREVHRALKRHRDHADPLDRVADDIAADIRVLCFDEFFVSDIADAMILSRLLDGLFRRGVTLVATSNVPPEDLYRDGLQRQRFLPAIRLLEKHARILEMDGGTDYRLRFLRNAEIYHSPLDDAAETVMEENFKRLAPDVSSQSVTLDIEGRRMQARAEGEGVIWFDFDAVCRGPRSQNDYIELARCYHTVLISGVPVMGRDDEDAARRFIALVDEFYDRNVKLILSAAAGVDELYQGRRLGFEFERTRSRLTAMRTGEYLSLPHLP
jgi:cell division protein ZapE